VVAEVLPPRSRTVEEVCQEHGISTWSLYRWKRAAKGGKLDHGAMKPSERPLAEKLSLLLEGARVLAYPPRFPCTRMLDVAI
jgi:transposase-like protein